MRPKGNFAPLPPRETQLVCIWYCGLNCLEGHSVLHFDAVVLTLVAYIVFNLANDKPQRIKKKVESFGVEHEDRSIKQYTHSSVT